MLPYFGDSVAGHPSRMLQPWARGLVLVTCSRVKGPIARGTQRFSWLNSWLPREWDFLLRKTLSKFFKSLGLKCFSGWPWRLIGDLFQSRKTRVLRFKDIFLKTFSVFLSNFCDCSLSSPFLSQLKLTQTFLKLHFCIISSPIFKKKVWVFSVSLHFSCFECVFFLDSVSVLLPLCLEKYHAHSRVCFILVSVHWLRVSVFDFITGVYMKSVVCFMIVLLHSYHVYGILSHCLSFKSL